LEGLIEKSLKYGGILLNFMIEHEIGLNDKKAINP
jgi:hypothetical protein